MRVFSPWHILQLHFLQKCSPSEPSSPSTVPWVCGGCCHISSVVLTPQSPSCPHSRTLVYAWVVLHYAPTVHSPKDARVHVDTQPGVGQIAFRDVQSLYIFPVDMHQFSAMVNHSDNSSYFCGSDVGFVVCLSSAPQSGPDVHHLGVSLHLPLTACCQTPTLSTEGLKQLSNLSYPTFSFFSSFIVLENVWNISLGFDHRN